jgi:hypothetical protein
MKKDGFVFVESVVVLVVVALSIAMLFSSYSLVTRKTKEKENYDKASDKYLIYVLSRLGTDDVCNYSVGCSNLSHKDISFRADSDPSSSYNCATTKAGEILYDCNKVFDDMDLVHLYVVENIRNELNNMDSDGNIRGTGELRAIDKFDNGTIEYMKTLKKCNDLNTIDSNGRFINNNTETSRCLNQITYMIGVFERGNGDYYYAAIEL